MNSELFFFVSRGGGQVFFSAFFQAFFQGNHAMFSGHLRILPILQFFLLPFFCQSQFYLCPSLPLGAMLSSNSSKMGWIFLVWGGGLANPHPPQDPGAKQPPGWWQAVCTRPSSPNSEPTQIHKYIVFSTSFLLPQNLFVHRIFKHHSAVKRFTQTAFFFVVFWRF